MTQANELSEQEEELHNALVKLSNVSQLDASTIVEHIESIKAKSQERIKELEKDNEFLRLRFKADMPNSLTFIDEYQELKSKLAEKEKEIEKIFDDIINHFKGAIYPIINGDAMIHKNLIISYLKSKKVRTIQAQREK